MNALSIEYRTIVIKSCKNRKKEIMYQGIVCYILYIIIYSNYLVWLKLIELEFPLALVEPLSALTRRACKEDVELTAGMLPILFGVIGVSKLGVCGLLGCGVLL